MLPAGCSRRLLAELRDALDACAERQRQLERSLRVSRRLLRVWEPAETPALEPTPGPDTNEEARPPARTPSPQDLKELELLTQALEKAIRVRKGLSKAGGRDEAPSRKSRSIVSPATTASVPPRASGQAGRRASETKPPRGVRQTTVPAKGLPELRLLSVGDQTCKARGAQAAKPEPGLRDQQIAPSAAPQAPEAFTLKQKGILLRLPMAFRKAASQNSRLWAQLSSTETSDSMDATTTAKTQFLRKMQSGWPSSRLCAAEVEAEVGRLRKACSLLRQRMGEELTADPVDWMQEYHCLLTLEGLQAIAGQCLHRLQELRAAVMEHQLAPWPEGRLPSAPSSCGGGADSIWSPQLLLYSSTQELQTLASLRLRVAMLDEQIHLEKVLMAELLPLVSTQEPLGPPWLALCRAVHSLLCEGAFRLARRAGRDCRAGLAERGAGGSLRGTEALPAVQGGEGPRTRRGHPPGRGSACFVPLPNSSIFPAGLESPRGIIGAQ
ncbi:tubulin epsilon and delta complex protein 2 isoform X1 [Equus asinus]|uniref:tubulin epsilon and delta complex protein 2 isoform X1 n=1 Tax=Equus asinus TaxID=9793 RepID=UPI000719EC9A|nr:tubulin epsilon and delta complex protein 2 isoform X1 [Equus asinus]